MGNHKEIIIILLVIFALFVFSFYNSIKNFFLSKKVSYWYNKNYKIIEIEDVFTPEECQQLIDVAKGRLEESKVWSNKNGSVKDENARISKQAWIKHEENIPVVNKLLEINKKYVGTHGSVEPIQVVNYQPGGVFKAHYDAGYGNNTNINKRHYTLLLYLNDNFKGGTTWFPKIDQRVVPKQGKIVIFQDTTKDGRIIYQSLHEGSPVLSGEKWIANVWTHTH